MKLAINCLSISNASALGVRTFLISHLRQFPDFGHSKLSHDLELLFIVQKGSLLKPEIYSILKNINSCVRVRIREVSGIEKSSLRILYEQFVLPLLTRDFDIVYSINNANPIFFFAKTHSIVTIHDLLPFKIVARYSRFQKVYLQLLTKLCSKRAAKIITVSNFTKSEIVELLNVTPSKVSVIYNCLPFSFEEVGNNSKQFLLIVGGLNTDKRVDCALRGFKEYLQRNPSSPLQLMITGPDQGARRQLEELSQNLGLTERCCFLGQISEDEKNKLLASCKAIVMMGRNEGFGIPVLEAMRLGKPTLAAKAGALPEVMGSAGVVVEIPENAECIADGIHEIMNSEINWVEACRAEYSRYNSSVISNLFWRCLTEVYNK